MIGWRPVPQTLAASGRLLHPFSRGHLHPSPGSGCSGTHAVSRISPSRALGRKSSYSTLQSQESVIQRSCRDPGSPSDLFCLHCAQESGHHPLQDLGCLLQRGRERSKDTFKNALGGKQRRKKMMLEFQVSYWIFSLLLLLRLLLGEGSPSSFGFFVDSTSFSQGL